MPRIELDLPDRFPFKTEIDIRTQDLDRSGHLSNQALLSLMEEARMKSYQSMGYQDGDIDGAGTVLADAVMVIEDRCTSGDLLAFEMAAGAFSRTSCDLFYRVTSTRTGTLVAKAKTTIDFIAPGTATPVEVPGGFRQRFV